MSQDQKQDAEKNISSPLLKMAMADRFSDQNWEKMIKGVCQTHPEFKQEFQNKTDIVKILDNLKTSLSLVIENENYDDDAKSNACLFKVYKFLNQNLDEVYHTPGLKELTQKILRDPYDLVTFKDQNIFMVYLYSDEAKDSRMLDLLLGWGFNPWHLDQQGNTVFHSLLKHKPGKVNLTVDLIYQLNERYNWISQQQDIIAQKKTIKPEESDPYQWEQSQLVVKNWRNLLFLTSLAINFSKVSDMSVQSDPAGAQKKSFSDVIEQFFINILKINDLLLWDETFTSSRTQALSETYNSERLQEIMAEWEAEKINEFIGEEVESKNISGLSIKRKI